MRGLHKILVIKSETSELRNVEDFLHTTFEECKISKENFNRIYLCISEAVINSIEHGNKGDKNKNVSIELYCKKNKINVFIKDEGEGFDISKIQDPTCKENIRKESGRGIHIIKSLSDKLEYNNHEKSIQFRFECI